MIKEILTKWSVNGNKLNNPLVIIARLAVWPIIRILGVIIYSLIFISWGKYDADRFWDTIT